MTAAALLCRFQLGQPASDKEVVGGFKLLAENLPAWKPQEGMRRSRINFYYWYYGTKALGSYRAEAWPVWRKALLKALVPHQREDGCEAGSWDPIGEWGGAGGRVYSTAIGALTLLAERSAGATPKQKEE